MSYETVPIAKSDPELITFAYWLQRTGELKKGYEIHFFASPEQYQKLWNAWVHLHREGFEDWQIEIKLQDHENGGWKV